MRGEGYRLCVDRGYRLCVDNSLNQQGYSQGGTVYACSVGLFAYFFSGAGGNGGIEGWDGSRARRPGCIS